MKRLSGPSGGPGTIGCAAASGGVGPWLEADQPLSVEIVGVCRTAERKPASERCPVPTVPCLPPVRLSALITAAWTVPSARRASLPVLDGTVRASTRTRPWQPFGPEAIRQRALAIRRVLTGVMTTFGMLALGLAVIGVHGLLAH